MAGAKPVLSQGVPWAVPTGEGTVTPQGMREGGSNLPEGEQGEKRALSRAGRRAGSRSKDKEMTEVLGRGWGGAGVRCGVSLGQVESLPTFTDRSGAREMFVVSLPQSQASAELGGSGVPPWEVRDGPQGPSQCQGLGRAISQAWDAAWSLPE